MRTSAKTVRRWYCLSLTTLEKINFIFSTSQLSLIQRVRLNPNRSLDRNVLISIVILLLLAVLCPSAAVFSSVPSRRSPLRLRQNGRKTVCHKYIIRLSHNDRFGFNFATMIQLRIHCGKKFLIVACMDYPVMNGIHRLYRVHVCNKLTQNPHTVKSKFILQQVIAPCA